MVLIAIAGGLCGFEQFEGPIPINKNLWTLSFVCLMGGWGFLVLGALYAIIDHFKTPLSQGLLSPLEIRKIFLNIEDLYATHLDFHEKLKLTMEQRFETRKISVPFKEKFIAPK